MYACVHMHASATEHEHYNIRCVLFRNRCSRAIATAECELGYELSL